MRLPDNAGMRPTFQAKYAGRCPDCGESIEVGDVVQYNEDGKVVHGLCDAAVAVAPARRGICPDCFTEKSVSGACGC